MQLETIKDRKYKSLGNFPLKKRAMKVWNTIQIFSHNTNSELHLLISLSDGRTIWMETLDMSASNA